MYMRPLKSFSGLFYYMGEGLQLNMEDDTIILRCENNNLVKGRYE